MAIDLRKPSFPDGCGPAVIAKTMMSNEPPIKENYQSQFLRVKKL